MCTSIVGIATAAIASRMGGGGGVCGGGVRWGWGAGRGGRGAGSEDLRRSVRERTTQMWVGLGVAAVAVVAGFVVVVRNRSG